jgi:hypothetical protein
MPFVQVTIIRPTRESSGPRWWCSASAGMSGGGDRVTRLADGHLDAPVAFSLAELARALREIAASLEALAGGS